MKLDRSVQACTVRKFTLIIAAALLVGAQLHSPIGWAQDADASGQAYYKNARPMLDYPLPELLNAVPELQGLDPAQNQDELSSVLQKTGEVTEDLMASMPNLISQEDVTQSRPSARGGGRDQIERKFDYMIVVHWSGADGSVEEYRTLAS